MNKKELKQRLTLTLEQLDDAKGELAQALAQLEANKKIICTIKAQMKTLEDSQREVIKDALEKSLQLGKELQKNASLDYRCCSLLDELDVERIEVSRLKRVMRTYEKHNTKLHVRIKNLCNKILGRLYGQSR